MHEPLADEDLIDPRKVVRQLVVGLVVLMVALGVSGKVFQTQLTAIGTTFVERFGGPGVALCFFVPDAVPVPGAHEFCTGFALIGGMGFWTIVAWASGGSLVGGSIGYVIGRNLQHTERFQRFMHGRGRAAFALVQRYGLWALAAGAVSPIPYSICCWAVGALDMRFGPFLAVSLLRIPRIAFYLWLIQVGFVTATR